MFEYIHNIEGRVRLRDRSLKANAALARELQRELRQIPGVRSVEINLVTGSVLILHDGRLATTNVITTALTPFAQASMAASLHRAPQGNLAGKAAQASLGYLAEFALERLGIPKWFTATVMTSVASQWPAGVRSVQLWPA